MAAQVARLRATICSSTEVFSHSTAQSRNDSLNRLVLAPCLGFKNLPVTPAIQKSSSTFTTRSAAMEKGQWWNKLGFGGVRASAAQTDTGSSSSSASSIAQGPDDDAPALGQEFATFGAGCFWGVELAFQRVPGVTKTEVGYTQGQTDKPTYYDVCSGETGHSEVVRVQFDPKECSYQTLLDVFWKRHDPTTLNRQGGDVGTQYRSGIYFYSPEQEKAIRESLESHQKVLNRPIVTEVLPAKKFYPAEEYHQQYLAKGGRNGSAQSPAKGCNDPIRCYG